MISTCRTRTYLDNGRGLHRKWDELVWLPQQRSHLRLRLLHDHEQGQRGAGERVALLTRWGVERHVQRARHEIQREGGWVWGSLMSFFGILLKPSQICLISNLCLNFAKRKRFWCVKPTTESNRSLFVSFFRLSSSAAARPTRASSRSAWRRRGAWCAVTIGPSPKPRSSAGSSVSATLFTR